MWSSLDAGNSAPLGQAAQAGIHVYKNLIAWLSVLWAAEYTELLLIPTAHIKAEGRGSTRRWRVADDGSPDAGFCFWQAAKKRTRATGALQNQALGQAAIQFPMNPA
ncbi:MAG: hypothetical protein ACPHP2_05495 [Limisphaerales bacterium]